MTYHDYPFIEVVASCTKLLNLGHHFHQKFSCDKCGQRLTVDRPDVLYETGTCEACGHTTNIQERGCNYMLVAHNVSPLDVLGILKKVGPGGRTL